MEFLEIGRKSSLSIPYLHAIHVNPVDIAGFANKFPIAIEAIEVSGSPLHQKSAIIKKPPNGFTPETWNYRASMGICL